MTHKTIRQRILSGDEKENYEFKITKDLVKTYETSKSNTQTIMVVFHISVARPRAKTERVTAERVNALSSAVPSSITGGGVGLAQGVLGILPFKTNALFSLISLSYQSTVLMLRVFPSIQPSELY